VIGDPVICFAVVIASILALSGLGGFCSQYMSRAAIIAVLPFLIVVLSAALVVHNRFISRILALPSLWRYGATLVFLIPSGVLMGILFPLAIRGFVNKPGQRAYSWAINGCASVITAVVAVQLVISHGIKILMICAMGCYLAALGCAVRFRRL
jgi:hypothetical protein